MNPSAGALVSPERVQIETGVSLAPRTTLQLGGPARFFASVSSEPELAEALAWAEARRLSSWVLGGGSNVVAPDLGLDGLVVSIALRGITCLEAAGKCLVSAKAGEPWDELVAFCVDSRLSGLECLSGIPGLVGATPIQNVGAYGQEVKDTLLRLRAFDRSEQRFVTIDASDCDFAYRSSRFKAREPGRFVISEVTFALTPNGAPHVTYPELARALSPLARTPTLQEVRDAVLALRRSKSMVIAASDPNARSCGSFFVNPVVSSERALSVASRLGDPEMPRFPQPDGQLKLSAAWLIERSGFQRGFRRGNVGLSSRHALALVCHEGASSQELLAFASEVQNGVRERSGVELTPEPSIW